MDLNPVEFFGGAVLGKAFSTLYAGIDDLIAKNRMFRSLFKVIRSRLDTLKPLIIDTVLSNEQLSYTNNDELRGLEKVLKVGERLVLKCSNVRLWDLYRKYKYARKLLAWEELERQLQLLQVQGIRDGKKTAVVVENIEVCVGSVKEGINQMSSTLGEVNQLMKVNFVVQDQPAESRAWCAVPELPEVIVGLEAPLKDLKTKLLGNDGFSMLVLTAPGGCGKTTLATNCCKDQEVREQLYRHNGPQVPTFQNEVIAVQWLQAFLKEEGKKPLLFVLDDVWSGSESLFDKFECRMANIRILVASRSEFRAFSPPYHLEMVGYDDAMKLFHHSASLGDKSSHIPPHLSRKIVKHCKGFPLAIKVVGRSLRAQLIEMWQNRLNQWSKGSSILDFETDLLLSLQSSLDALEKEKAIIKECFLDIGSLIEDKNVPVNALIDIWSELYDIDEDTSCISSVYELSNRSLANLIDKSLVLPTLTSNNILYVEAESSTLKLANMHLPEAEVLVLNLLETQKYAIPEFVEEMVKLKVLVITSEHFCDSQLSNFQSISWLCNLKRIRLEGISISYIFKNSIQVKSLKKLSLIRCDTRIGSVTSVKLSHAFPNLEEMYIEGFLLVLLRGLRDLISLKKITISRSSVYLPLPDTIGKLVNLEVLRLRSLDGLSKLPDSIKNLKKLNFLGISECMDLDELPEDNGEMRSLRKFDLRSCISLKKLPRSVLDLTQLEEVICDNYTESLWNSLLPSFRDRNQDVCIEI
ncbi:hypothetical protein ACLB2K_058477 [Fragaria x ananassa]